MLQTIDVGGVPTGTVVLMNPGDVHACNPIDNEHWSYQMLYLDTPWLTDLQYQLGFSTDQGYRAFNTPYTCDPVLYRGLLALYRTVAPRLHSVALRCMGRSDLAQDVVQESLDRKSVV